MNILQKIKTKAIILKTVFFGSFLFLRKEKEGLRIIIQNMDTSYLNEMAKIAQKYIQEHEIDSEDERGDYLQ